MLHGNRIQPAQPAGLKQVCWLWCSADDSGLWSVLKISRTVLEEIFVRLILSKMRKRKVEARSMWRAECLPRPLGLMIVGPPLDPCFNHSFTPPLPLQPTLQRVQTLGPRRLLAWNALYLLPPRRRALRYPGVYPTRRRLHCCLNHFSSSLWIFVAFGPIAMNRCPGLQINRPS